MAPLVPKGTEVLAGLELGGIPLAVMIGQVLNLPVAFVRKTPKEYGTCKFAEGPDLRNRSIVLVEDVVTSGGAILDAASALRAEGVSVEEASCVIERAGPGRDALSNAGLRLTSLFRQEEISAQS